MRSSGGFEQVGRGPEEQAVLVLATQRLSRYQIVAGYEKPNVDIL